MDACQALVVEHTDTAHPHVHVAVCRVDPETGKACGRKNDAKKLSAWAAKYERSRERVQAPESSRAGPGPRGVPRGRRHPGRRPRPGRRGEDDGARRGSAAPDGRRSAAPAGRPGRRRSGRSGRRTSRPGSSPRRRRTGRGASGCGWPARIGGGRRRQQILAPLKRLKLWRRAPDASRQGPGCYLPLATCSTRGIGRTHCEAAQSPPPPPAGIDPDGSGS